MRIYIYIYISIYAPGLRVVGSPPAWYPPLVCAHMRSHAIRGRRCASSLPPSPPCVLSAVGSLYLMAHYIRRLRIRYSSPQLHAVYTTSARSVLKSMITSTYASMLKACIYLSLPRNHRATGSQGGRTLPSGGRGVQWRD